METTMSERREELERLLETLKQQRDELHLQLHLAKAEARDEWTAMEGKWQQVEQKLGQLREVAGETAEEVGVAAGLLVDEIGRGYARLRKLF